MPATTKKTASKPAAKKPAAKAPKKQPVEAPAESKNQQGHNIQATMNAALLTVEQLAAKTGYSVGRVNEHVNYEVSKNRAKLNGKKQVQVLSQPKYRNEG